LKLRYHEALSSDAFNSNLRPYNAGTPDLDLASDKRYVELMELVGKHRLTGSNFVLKVPSISALEAT
jgi:hypothetical protein